MVVVGIKRSNIELKSCNFVQMFLDIAMPEIQNINTIAFQTKLQCQGLSRLIIFGSPLYSVQEKECLCKGVHFCVHLQEYLQVLRTVSGALFL